MPDTGGIREVNQTQTLSLRHSESSGGDQNEEKISGGKPMSNIRRVLILTKSLGIPMRDRGDVGSGGDSF